MMSVFGYVTILLKRLNFLEKAFITPYCHLVKYGLFKSAAKKLIDNIFDAWLFYWNRSRFVAYGLVFIKAQLLLEIDWKLWLKAQCNYLIYWYWYIQVEAEWDIQAALSNITHYIDSSH